MIQYTVEAAEMSLCFKEIPEEKMRLKNRKDHLPENRALRARLGRKSFSKVLIIVLCVLLTVLLALGGVAYTIGYMLYDNMHHETMDTAINTNLMSLREIIEQYGDYTGSDYSPEEIAEVKRGIIHDSYEKYLKPGTDYTDICKMLDADINADLSSLEGRFSREVLDFCQKAYRFGCADLVWEYSNIKESDTVDPDWVTAGPSDTTDTTDPADTTVPDDTTTPEDSATETTNIILAPTPDTEPPSISGVTVTDSDIYNILLIGVDTRDTSFAGRSDTIMVVSINKATKRIILSSFPRDLKVYDPSYGETKINSIYARAGSIGTSAGRLATAINYNFGIQIHDYVVINFSAFNKVLGIMGGVDVPLYYAEFYALRDHLSEEKKAELRTRFAGNESNSDFYVYVHLDAAEALQYSRIRKVYNPVTQKNERSNDFFRGERQRNVVWGLVRSLRNLDIEKVKAIAADVLPLVATSVTYNDFLLKIVNYLDYSSYSVSSFGFPVDGTWKYENTGASYVVITNFEKNKAAWRAFVYK